jgi:RNA polymerase sigma-70 factor (ECF subfamily)
MTEETGIIRAVLEGDTESFRLLVQRYEKPIIRMIANLINDRHICEDVAQEVFLAAYKKLPSFNPARSSFSTWLFTIARNKSINAMKKKRILSAGNPPENPDFTEPIDTLVRDELFIKLDQALKLLNPKQRRAIVLAEFEKLPYEQIARIEGVRPGTIKSRVNRAKHRLKSVLDGTYGDIK